MRTLYEKHWSDQNWGTRAWSMVWLSPILVTVLLALLPILFDDANIAYVTLFVWTSVAVVSAVFADVMRRRAKKAARAAQRKCAPGDPAREFAKGNHGVAANIEIVHTVFLMVGVATIVFPEDWELRKLFSRDGIMFGQYMLMLVVLRTYYLDHVIRKMLKNNKI